MDSLQGEDLGAAGRGEAEGVGGGVNIRVVFGAGCGGGTGAVDGDGGGEGLEGECVDETWGFGEAGGEGFVGDFEDGLEELRVVAVGSCDEELAWRVLARCLLGEHAISGEKERRGTYRRP